MLQNSTPETKSQSLGKKFTPLVRKGDCLLPAPRRSPHSSSSSPLGIRMRQDTDDKENIGDSKSHMRKSSKEMQGHYNFTNLDQSKQRMPDLKENQTPYDTDNIYISVSDLPDTKGALTKDQFTSPNPKMKLLYSIKRILSEVNKNDAICSEAKSNATDENALEGSFDRYLHQKSDLNTPKSCFSEKNATPGAIDSALCEVEERIAQLELAAANHQKKSNICISTLSDEMKIGGINSSIDLEAKQELSDSMKARDSVTKCLISCFDSN